MSKKVVYNSNGIIRTRFIKSYVVVLVKSWLVDIFESVKYDFYIWMIKRIDFFIRWEYNNGDICIIKCIKFISFFEKVGFFFRKSNLKVIFIFYFGYCDFLAIFIFFCYVFWYLEKKIWIDVYFVIFIYLY